MSDQLFFEIKLLRHFPCPFFLDLQGRVVFETSITKPVDYIDVSKLNSGIYFVQWFNHSNEPLGSQKIIKN